MDAELLELQRQFESVQQAKSSVRLSERNVVELVQKLQDLRFLDFNLLHTASGKEYITPEQLRLEIEMEVTKSGRVSLISLSDIIGVDLYHIERQAQLIVADNPGLMLINGDIISQSYWDTTAEEINEKLQECSQIALAEIAAQLHVGSELVLSVLAPRLGTVNSFISYDVLHKLAIPQPKQYLKSRYPEGVVSDNIFIHPSMVEMMDAAIEDAVENGNWIDCLTVLPASLGSQDAAKLISCCPCVQKAVKSSKAIILSESFIFSVTFLKDMFDKLEKELETLSYANFVVQALSSGVIPPNDQKIGGNPSQFLQSNKGGDDLDGGCQSHTGSKKKRGKSTGSVKASTSESYLEPQEIPSSKVKKNQRKGRDGSTVDVVDTKAVSKKGGDKAKEDNLNIPSEEWVIGRILAMYPDIEEQGGSDNLEMLPKHLCLHLRPLLLTSWKKRRNTLLLESTDRRRRLLENLQKQLDESFLDLQLYEKALDLFEDDLSTSNILHKHLLRGIATLIVDRLLVNLDIDNKLMNGIKVDGSSDLELRTLNSGERLSIAKGLPGSLSVKAQLVVEALERKRLDAFMIALKEVAEECGIILKKLDKKLERTLLHSYRKDLILQVTSEADPVALLPKVIALLYLQVYNKALQAPGRALASALSHLKDKLPGSTYEAVMDYHKATVTLLALLSAATGDEEDCSADRILSKRELLESKMLELKGLVLNSSDS